MHFISATLRDEEGQAAAYGCLALADTEERYALPRELSSIIRWYLCWTYLPLETDWRSDRYKVYAYVSDVREGAKELKDPVTLGGSPKQRTYLLREPGRDVMTMWSSSKIYLDWTDAYTRKRSESKKKVVLATRELIIPREVVQKLCLLREL